MKKTALIFCTLWVLLLAVSASADQITYPINVPNSDLSPYPAPYADVLVNLTSSTTAAVTFTGDASGGFLYRIGGAQAADLNVNATSFTATSFTWTGGNAQTAFTPDYFPNSSVSQFGKLNLQIDNFDGFNSAVTQLSFTLTNTQAGGNWTNAANVLTPDADGFLAAAHIFVVDSTGANPATGFAGNGTPVPEPATMLLLGSGLIGLAGLARKKFRKIS